AEGLEVVEEGQRVVDVGGARRVRRLPAEALAVDEEAAVARLVLGEAFEEDHVGGHRDHRIAGHEMAEQLGIVAAQLVRPLPASPPVHAVHLPELLFEAGRDGLPGEALDLRLLRLAEDELPQLGLLAELVLLPLLVGRLVLLLEAQVSDDDVVERADRLAEAQGMHDLAVEVDLGPGQVRGEGESQAGAARPYLAPSPVPQLEVHATSRPWRRSSGSRRSMAARRPGWRKAARARAARPARRSGARTLRRAIPSRGSRSSAS